MEKKKVKKVVDLDTEKSKLSLAEVYEKEVTITISLY